MDAPKSPKVKPLLRGFSHLMGFLLSLLGFGLLLSLPIDGPRRTAGLVYVLSQSLLFGSSALYHVPMWPAHVRAVLRRIDHSAINLLIAGTYTPFAVLASNGEVTLGIQVMWGGALAGVALAVFWSHMPRGLRSGLYVGLGLMSLPLVMQLPGLIGWPRLSVVLGGSAIYAIGSLVYAFRYPNPWPKIFGYHEVFHLMVVAAAAMQYAVVFDVQKSL